MSTDVQKIGRKHK